MGISNPSHLAQFLGKRIAIHVEGNIYHLYRLSAIFADRMVQVKDKDGNYLFFGWDRCDNPYMILLDSEVEIETK